MPIEIRELVIKAEVASDNAKDEKNTSLSQREKDRIIEECVSHVLKALRRTTER